MLSLSEVTLICENRQKYANFESLICEKKIDTWRLWYGNKTVEVKMTLNSSMGLWQDPSLAAATAWDIKPVVNPTCTFLCHLLYNMLDLYALVT